MRVSIVTPSYNQAQYLGQTLRSVIRQGYPDLEYIVVDGGSTDGSVDIIRRYEKHLTWWVSEPDQGQAEAINKGLRRASGEIVAWLNSDDLYAPGAINQAVQVFQTHPEVGLVYGNAVTFDQDGHPLNDLEFGNWGLEGLLAFRIICQPAVFIRRTRLVEAGYLDESYHFLLDHHLWLRIGRLAPMLHVPQVWAFARHHAHAKNVAQAAAFGEEAFRILDWAMKQPDLCGLISANRRVILAAVHRFKARYLLDGGQAGPALKSYLRSLLLHPSTALQEWHRMLYSAMSLLGLASLGRVYYRRQRRKLPSSVLRMGIQNINDLYPEEDD